VSELRKNLEALESAREFMLIKIERGEAHHINHRVVGATGWWAPQGGGRVR